MYPALTAPVEGRTNWKLFGAVMGGGLAAIGAMTGLVMKGMVALALDIPVTSFEVNAQQIQGSPFSLVPADPQSDPAQGAKVKMSGDLTGMKITKPIDLTKYGLGKWDVIIQAGGGSTPVHASGMTVYASSLGGDTASFNNLTMDGATSGMSAPNINMQNANLVVPYLSTDSITLPNMSLSIQKEGGS
jgi:hypothetical protein